MIGKLSIFQARSGDCMAVSYTGDDGKRHHLIIDSGYEDTFECTLRPLLNELLDSGGEECVDLFILTHIDNDHLSGMQAFVYEFGHEKALVAEYLFNYSPKPFAIFRRKRERSIGVGEGINLREYLRETAQLNERPVLAPSARKIAGATLTFLSPTQKKYDRHLKDWEQWGTRERAIEKWPVKEQTIGSARNDHKEPLSALIVQQKDAKPRMDTSSNNGSSIAFLFELGAFRILFLADAHPSVIVHSLKTQFKCTKDDKLRVDFVKLSHHGSARNTSLQMLELIDCTHFIVSTDGYSPHHHPHKETFARILYQRSQWTEEAKRNAPVYFYFNHKNYLLEGIFSEAEKQAYNIHLVFPEHDNRLEITWR